MRETKKARDGDRKNNRDGTWGPDDMKRVRQRHKWRHRDIIIIREQKDTQIHYERVTQKKQESDKNKRDRERER